MKVTVPQTFELAECEVRRIVRTFLKEKYGLMSTEFEHAEIFEGQFIVQKFDTRGRQINESKRPASQAELAADLIIKSV